MLKSTRRNNGKGRNNRMHPNEARMQEDYYSSAATIITDQQEVSEMASLSINALKPLAQKETIMSNEQTQQEQAAPAEITVTETVTKPTSRRALPARQAKQETVTETEVIITPPPTDVPQQTTVIPLIVDGETINVIQLTAEEAAIVEDNADATPQEEVDLVLEPTVLDEPEVAVIPEVRKRTIPETRGSRPSMLPPKVEAAPKVEPTVTVAPKGYTDAGDHYERKVEVSALGVTASVTMTKPKPGSAGLIFEGRIDLEEAEGVQFWRPVFNRKLTPDDHVPAHYVPVIVQAARFRNSGMFDPVFLIAIPCTVGDMNDPGVEICSDTDGTVITFKAA